MKTVVSSSILAGDHTDLKAGVKKIVDSGASWLHIDVMDGHFVPNLAFGPTTVQMLTAHKQNLFFEVHLMLTYPESFVGVFAKMDVDLISIHLESSCDVSKVLKMIRAFGKKAGLAVNPGTPIERVFPYINEVDLVVIMGIDPGFCGQKFIESSLEKIEALRRYHASVKIEVDGGISLKNAPLCIQRGANVIVIGTAFFAAQNPKKVVQQIENE